MKLSDADARWKFIEDALIGDSIYSAFQRGCIYASDMKPNDGRRLELHRHIAKLLRELKSAYEGKALDRKAHERNIQYLADTLSEKFSTILRDGRFRIGIAQKVLNIYLKNMWCLGKIQCPPDCPFDAIMISRKMPKGVQDIQWTKIDDIEDYRRLIDAAEQASKASYGSLSLWELHEYLEWSDS